MSTRAAVLPDPDDDVSGILATADNTTVMPRAHRNEIRPSVSLPRDKSRPKGDVPDHYRDGWEPIRTRRELMVLHCPTTRRI